MTILYLLKADGGFLCGCTETGRTSYSYPTSTNAQAARRHPDKTALRVIADSLRLLPVIGCEGSVARLAGRNERWLEELRRDGTAVEIVRQHEDPAMFANLADAEGG